MTQIVGLSIDVSRGLGISPLRTKHIADFFSGRSWPNIRPAFIFSSFIVFVKIDAHKERAVCKYGGGYL